MPRTPVTSEHQCNRCDQVFTSQMRLEHHRAAEHAPKTSADIPRTSLVMARIRHRMLRVLQAASCPNIKTSAAPAARIARV